MYIFEKISSLSQNEALNYWFEFSNKCREVQEEILMGILDNAKDTDIGKKYGFEKIKSIKEFQEKIPIMEYEDIEDYIERIALGEEDLLFPGKPLFFISTSGTTGTSKKIPESDLSQKAKSAISHIRNGLLLKIIFEKVKDSPKRIETIKRLGFDLANPKNAVDKFHYYSVTSASPNKKTKGGIDIGFASGKTFDNSAFTEGLSYPKEIMGLKNGEATMYLSMLFGLRYDDIVIIVSNNAGRVYSRVKYAQEHAEKIIDDLRNGTISHHIELSEDERKLFESYIEPNPKRADELENLLNKGKEYFIPKYYWPNILSARFWLSGSVGVNVDKLKKYLPEDVIYLDVGYGASEGKLNIPHEENSGAGTLAIASIFYEFVSQKGELLTADQLKEGEDYELLLTTFSGLYRYPLHDIVRVKGFVGNTPDIEFISKSKEILNIAQEKLSASLLLDSLNDFLIKKGLIYVQSQIYQNLENSSYDLYLELENYSDDLDSEKLSIEFDNLLRSNFGLYDRNRKFKSLKRLNFIFMKNGWQNHLYKQKENTGAPQSQIKLESIANKRAEKEWVIK